MDMKLFPVTMRSFPPRYGRNACTVIPKDRPHGLTGNINGLVHWPSAPSPSIVQCEA